MTGELYVRGRIRKLNEGYTAYVYRCTNSHQVNTIDDWLRNTMKAKYVTKGNWRDYKVKKDEIVSSVDPNQHPAFECRCCGQKIRHTSRWMNGQQVTWAAIRAILDDSESPELDHWIITRGEILDDDPRYFSSEKKLLEEVYSEIQTTGYDHRPIQVIRIGTLQDCVDAADDGPER